MDIEALIEEEFPIRHNRIFLNHAAISPLPARAARALTTFAEASCQDGGHAWPRWAEQLKLARREAARLLKVDAENEIGFVHNTTHGLLCVANSINWKPGDNIVSASYEFPANVQVWRQLRERGVELRAVPERSDYTYSAEAFRKAIDSRTRMIAISLVQYSTGFRMPVEAIGELCRKHKLWYCLDAIQATGAIPVYPREIGCDFIVSGSQKWLMSSEGMGILWMPPERVGELNESMTGWTGRVRPWDYTDYDQRLIATARRFEEGAYNMAVATAMNGSLSLLNEIGIETVWERLESLTARLREGARGLGWQVISPDGPGQRSGIIQLAHKSIKPETAMDNMEKQAIHVAARRGWLRVSPHFYNSPEQIDRFLDALKALS